MDFQKQFLALPENHRSFQGRSGQFQNWPEGDCFFGVPGDELYGRQVLETIPDGTNSFHFYLGADAIDLMKAFVNSNYPSSLEYLAIGNSCYNFGSGFDYAAITQTLSEAVYPKLKSFEFGVWQLFSNSHAGYGKLGELSGLLKTMSQVEALALYGHFTLNNTIDMPHLRQLQIVMDDPVTGMNGGNISPETFSNFLMSSFPNLKTAYIDLENEDSEHEYQFPADFFSGQTCPSLEKLEILGNFSQGQRDLLHQSELCKRQDFKLFV